MGQCQAMVGTVGRCRGPCWGHVGRCRGPCWGHVGRCGGHVWGDTWVIAASRHPLPVPSRAPPFGPSTHASVRAFSLPAGTHLLVAVALHVKGGKGADLADTRVAHGALAHKVDNRLRARRRAQGERDGHEHDAEDFQQQDLDAQLEELGKLRVHLVRVQLAAPGRRVVVRVVDDATDQQLGLEHLRLDCGMPAGRASTTWSRQSPPVVLGASGHARARTWYERAGDGKDGREDPNVPQHAAAGRQLELEQRLLVDERDHREHERERARDKRDEPVSQ